MSRYSEYQRRYRRENDKKGWLGLLAFPFQWIAGLLGQLFSVFSSPFVNKKYNRQVYQRRTIIGWIGVVLTAPFTFLWFVLVSIFTFVVNWASTRRGRALMYGLPAFLIAGSAIGLLGYAKYVQQPRLARPYSATFYGTRQEVVAMDPETDKEQIESAQEKMEIYLKKLIDLDSDNDKYKFELALLFIEKGEMNRAGVMLNRLAPNDKPGYALAHKWRSQQLLARNPDGSPTSKEQVQEAEKHLRYALTREPRDYDSWVRCAVLSRMQGKMESAVSDLEEAAKIYKDVLVELASAQKAVGRAAESKVTAERYIAYIQGKIDAEASKAEKTPRLYNDLCRGHIFLENYPQAERALRQGMVFFDGKDKIMMQYRLNLSQVYVLWGEKIKNADSDSQAFSRKLQLLEASLQLNPTNQRTLAAIATLIFMDDEKSEQAKELLMEAQINGIANGTVHLILGSNAAAKGQIEKAEFHLNQARDSRGGDKAPVVLNNLAWVLAHKEEPELVKSLELAKQAINVDNSNPEFYHTRGKVLFLMERYDDSLKDLLVALEKIKTKPKLHSLLADVYAKLAGSVEDEQLQQSHLELSIRHRDRADQLTKK